MTANLRRRLISLGVFSLLGALTTIAVAWLSILWLPVSELRSTRSGGSKDVHLFDENVKSPGYSGWMVIEYRSHAVDRYMSSWYDEGVSWGLGGGWPSDPPEPLVPNWAPFIAPTNHVPEVKSHRCIAEALGWPFRAVSGGFMVSHEQGSSAPAKLTSYWAIVVDSGQVIQPNGWQHATLLPYKPLVGGFLGDMLVYGLIWFVLWLCCRTAWRVIIYRQRFQFSLRTLLAFMTLASVLLAWVGYSLNWMRQRHAALEENERFGIVTRDDDPSMAPALLWLFGEDGVAHFYCEKCTPEDRIVLQRLFPESQILDLPTDEQNRPTGSSGLF